MKKIFSAITLSAAAIATAHASPLDTPEAAVLAAVFSFHKHGVDLSHICTNATRGATELAVIGKHRNGQPATIIITRDGENFDLSPILGAVDFPAAECRDPQNKIIEPAQ